MEKEELDIEALREKREVLRKQKNKKRRILLITVLIVCAAAVLGIVLSKQDRAAVTLELIKEGSAEVIQKEDSRKHCLNIYADDVTGTFSPAYASAYGDRIVSGIVFEPLMKRDETGALQNCLIKNLQVSEDGLTYTVTLKSPILFSDGTELTVEDVFASITAAACANASEDANDSYHRIVGMPEYLENPLELPEGFVKVSETEFQILFSEACADNLLLMETGIQKGNYSEEFEGQEMVTEILNHYNDGIGTGAYCFTEASDGSICTLQANENYREKIRDIKTIEFCGITYYDLPEAVEKGEIDIALYSGKSGLFETFFDWEGFDVYSRPEETVYALYYNQDHELLTSKKIRQAISYAFNRERETLTGALPYILFEDGMLLQEKTAGNAYGYDAAKAKKLLQEALKEAENPETELSLTLPVLESSEVQKTLAEALQKDLQDIGITLEVQELSQQDYVQTLYLREDFDLYLTEISIDESIASLKKYYQPSDGMPVDVQDETVEKAYEALQQSYSLSQAEKNRRELLSAIEEAAPVTVLGRSRSFLSVSADLSGFGAAPHQTFVSELHKIRVK